MNDKRKQFGEDLVQQRTQKGVSLEAMSRATKIRKPVLEALESGRFEELPPEVFVVGFLQAYANHLGIDPGQVVARYRRLVEAPLPPDRQQERAKIQEISGPNGKKPTLLLGIVIAVLLVAAGAYLVWAWNTGGWPFQDIYRPSPVPEEPSQAANTTETQPPPAWANAPANEAQPPVSPSGNEPAPSTNLPLTATNATQEPANAPAASPPQFPSANVPAVPPANVVTAPPVAAPQSPAVPLPSGDVVIVCTKRCWIEMYADGKRKLYREVTPGERLVYDGKTFKLNIGNPQGIQLIYLGQNVPLPDTGGRSLKNFVLPSSGGAPR